MELFSLTTVLSIINPKPAQKPALVISTFQVNLKSFVPLSVSLSFLDFDRPKLHFWSKLSLSWLLLDRFLIYSCFSHPRSILSDDFNFSISFLLKRSSRFRFLTRPRLSPPKRKWDGLHNTRVYIKSEIKGRSLAFAGTRVSPFSRFIRTFRIHYFRKPYLPCPAKDFFFYSPFRLAGEEENYFRQKMGNNHFLLEFQGEHGEIRQHKKGKGERLRFGFKKKRIPAFFTLLPLIQFRLYKVIR